jgi:hypothetical protein
MKFTRAIALTLFVCSAALFMPPRLAAQNAAIMPIPKQQFGDANGAPLAGGYLYTCAAGLACVPSIVGNAPLNPLATYTDTTGAVANQNPIILDSAGRASVSLGSGMYKIVALDTFGAQQWSADNVSAGAAISIPGTNGAASINFTASGAGAVTRTVAAVLADTSLATNYGTTSGIAQSIAACGSSPCAITVPASDPTTEAVPGNVGVGALSPAAATTPGTISIIDQRYGDYRTWVNPRGNGYPSGNTRYPLSYTENVTEAGGHTGTNFGIVSYNQFNLDGGANYIFGSPLQINKANYLQKYNQMSSYTPGQHISESHFNFNYSVGDALNEGNYQYCWGGINSGGDEGCEDSNHVVIQGYVEYRGAVSGGATTGSQSVTVAPTQGASTQGVGRWLVDETTGVITAGTISAISAAPASISVITGSGTSWAVSTVAASLGTNVAVGVATVTPGSFTIGSIAGISTSTNVCVWDNAGFEMVRPTAVGGGTFTASFTYPHVSTSNIAVGGLCGFFYGADIDQVTNSTFAGVLDIGLTGTIHYLWPVVASTSSTSAQVWASAQGNYQQLPSLTQWSGANPNYHMYPGAVVTSVVQNGGLSNTLTLSGNSAAWTIGDLVFEAEYPAEHLSQGHNFVQKVFPAIGAAASTFRIDEMFGIWNGNDHYHFVVNGTPISMYTSNGGTLAPPIYDFVFGAFNYKDNWQYAPPTVSLFGCPAAGCDTGATTVFRFTNGSGSDYMQYNQTLHGWIFSAGNGVYNYDFLDAGIFQAPTVTATVAISGPTVAATTTLTAGTTVTAGTVFKVGATSGLTVVKNLKGSDGNNCTETFTGGILTASTCP